MRRRGLPRRARGVTAFLGLNALVLGLAVTYHGVPMAEVHLNDGGVWVTNGSMRLAAHLNYPSRTLDGGVVAPSGDFDVSQQANDVALHDLGQSTVSSIDTATVEIGTPVPVSGFTAVQGGDVVAVADPRKGRVWTSTVSALGSFSPDTEPVLDELDGVQVAVADDGEAVAVEPDGTIHVLAGAGRGSVVVQDGGVLVGLDPGATFSLTMVGRTVVALDDAGRVHTVNGVSDGKVPAGSALQLPGPTSDGVVLAAPDGLLRMSLAGGGVDRLGPSLSAGAPAAPAVLDGCVYAVWSGSGSYVRDCAGEADDVDQAYDALADTELPQFRVNRDVIVLNDTANGNVFLVNDGMRLVDNWDDIARALTEDQKTKRTKDKLRTRAAPKRTNKNTDPKANPDSFGVRPGRATTLPVLANDTDADGDFLTASAKDSSLGRVSRVRGGAALQLTPDDEVTSGTDSFSYTAADVSNLARVFTGYDHDYSQSVSTTVSGTRSVGDTSPTRLPMALNNANHSTLAATFLGTTIAAGTPGAAALQTALDTLFNHPNAGPFLCKQLIQRLVTSNPSAAYVDRVATVFEANGTRRRGDLALVVAAILMDDEARAPAGLTQVEFGKLREPMLRLVQWARTFGVTSVSGAWKITDLSDPATRLGQSPLRASSVFNFFRPGYVPPGATLSAGKVAPEFQLVTESSVGGYLNFMMTIISSGMNLNDITTAYTDELALVLDADALVRRVNLLMSAGQLSSANHSLIVSALNATSVTATSSASVKRNRVCAAILMVMASAEYLIQK